MLEHAKALPWDDISLEDNLSPLTLAKRGSGKRRVCRASRVPEGREWRLTGLVDAGIDLLRLKLPMADWLFDPVGVGHLDRSMWSSCLPHATIMGWPCRPT